MTQIIEEDKLCGESAERMGVGNTIFVETYEAKGTTCFGYLGVVG
jgi:hypothetical protein